MPRPMPEPPQPEEFWDEEDQMGGDLEEGEKMSEIKISIEQWGQLCDALSVAPDCPVEDIIAKIKELRKLCREQGRQIYNWRMDQNKEGI